MHDDAHLLRSAERGERAARTLGESDALVLRGNGGITTGTSPGHAVTREIAAWRTAAPSLLERLWVHLRRTAGTA